MWTLRRTLWALGQMDARAEDFRERLRNHLIEQVGNARPSCSQSRE